MYACASIPPAGFNVYRYCSRAVDALNDRYLQSFDPAARKATAAAMQRAINADLPGIVLYERLFLAAYTNKLTGYHPSAYSYWGDPLEMDSLRDMDWRSRDTRKRSTSRRSTRSSPPRATSSRSRNSRARSSPGSMPRAPRSPNS